MSSAAALAGESVMGIAAEVRTGLEREVTRILASFGYELPRAVDVVVGLTDFLDDCILRGVKLRTVAEALAPMLLDKCRTSISYGSLKVYRAKVNRELGAGVRERVYVRHGHLRDDLPETLHKRVAEGAKPVDRRFARVIEQLGVCGNRALSAIREQLAAVAVSGSGRSAGGRPKGVLRRAAVAVASGIGVAARAVAQPVARPALSPASMASAKAPAVPRAVLSSAAQAGRSQPSSMPDDDEPPLMPGHGRDEKDARIARMHELAQPEDPLARKVRIMAEAEEDEFCAKAFQIIRG